MECVANGGRISPLILVALEGFVEDQTRTVEPNLEASGHLLLSTSTSRHKQIGFTINNDLAHVRSMYHHGLAPRS